MWGAEEMVLVFISPTRGVEIGPIWILHNIYRTEGMESTYVSMYYIMRV